jgi:S1-C subfamily serine protease
MMNRRERAIQLIKGQAMNTVEQGRREVNMENKSTASDIELLDCYSRAVIQIAETVRPAVVGISIEPASGEYGPEQVGSGSGVIFSPEGYILTNYHVIHGAQQVMITLADGRRFSPDLVGVDPVTDLAVLYIEAADLPYAVFGDSRLLRVGQMIVTIGNPLGFQSTVSTGVISAVGRVLKGSADRMIGNIIQHTAPLNPGNSGSPLVDSHGRIVGLNTAIIMRAQGIGFSIPSATLKSIACQLLTYFRVRRAYLGFSGDQVQLNSSHSNDFYLQDQIAVKVASVESFGPADRAGLKRGDFISAVNGEQIKSIEELNQFLSEWPAGEELCFTIVRKSGTTEIKIIPCDADSA